MKILLVSKDLREADFLDHEVNRVLAPVQFDVQHDLQSLEQLHEPGLYDALLLDSSVPRTQSLQLIAELREHNVPLPILVLADARDENNPGDLLRTVADEWIPKRPGFINALTGYLRRLNVPDRATPELEQPASEPESVRQRSEAEEKQASNQKDLLETLRKTEERNAVLENAVRQAEARVAQLIEERRIEQENWELAHQGLKEQGAWIENVVRTLRAKHGSLLENHRAEQQKWETIWKEEDQRRQETEKQLDEVRAAYEAALSQQAQRNQEHDAERARLESRIRELEQESSEAPGRADLEAALSAAGTRYAELLEEYRKAEARWQLELDSAKNTLEETEKRRASAAAALDKMEAAQAETVRDIGSLQVRWEQERSDLEAMYRAASQENAGLKAALDAALEQKETVSQEVQGERDRRESALQELERKDREWQAEREQMQAALREAEIRFSEQLREAQRGPRLDLDQVQQERDQLRKQLREEGDKCEKLLNDRSESYDRLLGETVSQLRRDEAERLKVTSERHRLEVETLEQSLRRASEENQQLSKQLQSERDRLQAELADLSTRYQRLTDMGGSGVVVATLDGVVMRCNDAAARMFGFAGSEEALQGPNRFVVFRGNPAFLRTLQQDGRVSGVQWALRSGDGRILRLLENATVIGGFSECGTLVERIFSDVTRLHELEDELARIEVVRQTATAAVQSFNEVCASLSRSSGLLASSLDPTDPRHAGAERLVHEAGSAIKLARQFLSFVRREPRSPEPVDVNSIVLESEQWLRDLAGDDVDFELSLASQIGPVMADRRELRQVFTKLASTSRESLPMGGTLTIETAEVEGDRAEVNFGAQVVVRIATAGCGVQPERRTILLKHMVKRSGGRLEVSGDPVAGNVLQLFLPRVLPLNE